MIAKQSNSDTDSSNRVEEAIEIDQQVWQCVCDKSAANDMTNSEFIEEILTEHLEDVQ